MKGGIILARISTKTLPHEYGEGGICIKDIRGKKMYQYTYFMGGKKYRRYFNCDDDGLKAVKALRKQINRDKEDGITGTTNSLYEMINEYLLSRKDDLTEATKKRYVSSLFALYTYNEKLLNQQFDTISKLDIEKAINIVKENKSNNEAKKALSLLNATFSKAVDDEIIRKNPCKKIKSPTIKTPKRNIFSNEEIIRLFSTIRYMRKDPMYHLTERDYFTLILFLFCTGVRINEGLATKWTDITSSEEYPEIHIQRTLDSHHTGGGQVTKIPKTEAGNRLVPLPPRLVRRLNKIRPDNANALRGYIFPTSTGTALDVHNFYRTWHAILRATARECPSCHTKRPNFWKCSCGHLVTHNAIECPKCKMKRPKSWTCPTCDTIVTEVAHKCHEIRHTYASKLANSGKVPDTLIACWLGHSSADVLWKIYAHKPTSATYIVKDLFEKKRKPKKT